MVHSVQIVASALGLCAVVASGFRLRGRGNSSGNVSQQAGQGPFADSAALHQCASGKRIVYVGDSTFRYEYMALAYFLEHGQWPAAKSLSPDPSNEWDVIKHFQNGPNFPVAHGCIDGGGQAWEQFYRYTNGLLNDHEACDCFREDTDVQGTTATENRVYRSLDGSRFASYFQWFGEVSGPHGTMDVASQAAGEVGAVPCPAGQTPLDTSFEWETPLPEFVATVVRQLKPTHLIVSLAWWPGQKLTQEFWSSLATAGAAAVSDTGGTVYWRTTPKPREKREPNAIWAHHGHLFSQAGWQTYQAADFIDQLTGTRTTADMFNDGVHLRSEGNSHLAASFLRSICGR